MCSGVDSLIGLRGEDHRLHIGDRHAAIFIPRMPGEVDDCESNSQGDTYCAANPALPGIHGPGRFVALQTLRLLDAVCLIFKMEFLAGRS